MGLQCRIAEGESRDFGTVVEDRGNSGERQAGGGVLGDRLWACTLVPLSAFLQKSFHPVLHQPWPPAKRPLD